MGLAWISELGAADFVAFVAAFAPAVAPAVAIRCHFHKLSKEFGWNVSDEINGDRYSLGNPLLDSCPIRKNLSFQV